MERFELARTLVLQAGDMLRRIHFEFGDVHQKTGHQDLVTKWDAETERFLRRAILSAFPHDSIIGEEFPAAGQNGNVTWYLDPIDGTTNFINAHRSYAVSVGCWQDTTPLFGLVLDAERQTLYSARAGHGAWRDETAIHVSGRSNISDLLLSVPDIVYTFLKPHTHQDCIIQLARGRWSCAPWRRAKKTCSLRRVPHRGITTQPVSSSAKRAAPFAVCTACRCLSVKKAPYWPHVQKSLNKRYCPFISQYNASRAADAPRSQA